MRNLPAGLVAGRELAERLRRLEDEWAVLDRLYAFAQAIDAKSKSEWLDCFTADGQWSWQESANLPPRFDVQGRDALEIWIGDHERRFPPGEEHHVVTNPRVLWCNGHEAQAESWYVVVRSEGDSRLGVRSTGRYHDRLVRERDGEWRIAQRRAVGEMPRPPKAS